MLHGIYYFKFSNLTPYHFVFSGRAATANRGHPNIIHPPAPPVSVEGTKASLQEKKKQSHTTFAKKTRPTGNNSKIRNYNIKD